MDKYLLSVDNGLTTTKAVLFTRDGKEVASCYVNTVIESKGDCAEVDMELQWSNTAKVIAACIAKSGVDPSDIIGVGNSGHGAGLYCLDEDNKPVRKAVSSMDARANTLIDDWKREGRSPYHRIWQNFWSGQAIPILSWLKGNEPQSYKRIKSVLMVKDWIVFRLTGSVGIEFTDASNSGLINPMGKTIDKELLEQFGLGEVYDKIPQLRRTTHIAGYITKEAGAETGLKAGTPVMGGIFDCIACALGSGVYDHDKYSIIAGTWNINSGIQDDLINPSETIKCSLYADIDRYFYVESSATSAVNLSWFMDNIIRGFLPSDLTDHELHRIIGEKIAEIDPAESDIIYLPFLYKSHLANMEGAFLGLKPEYTVFNMLRGVFEGVAFAHRMHIENLISGGIKRECAVLSGGASKSAVWSQLFADVLNMEIATTEASEAGALGTAACTAVALGVYRDLGEAIASMVRVKKHFYPDSRKKEIYDKKYDSFINIIKKLTDK